MKRNLSDIPTAELSALVEQGMPVSDYAAEIQRRRPPDCVFNVWPDGYIYQANKTASHSAASWREWNKTRPRHINVTHRIRVFLKGAA